MGTLTVYSVNAISKPGRHGDGGGLYLNVAPSGTKSWVHRIVVNEKRCDIGLGSYPAVSLRRARSLAADNRSAVAEGRNPLSEKWETKAAARNSAPSVPTFAEAAARVIEFRRPAWSNPKHAAQWESTLATYVFPFIGETAVDEITATDVLAVLEPIWTTKPETASRVKQRVETVMDWVVTHSHRLDNPAGKALLKVLPPVNRESNHHPALHYSQVGWALAKVRESTSNLPTKLAFEFLVLTAARSGEVRNANWGEILWDRRTWEIPHIKMKARRFHRVPLSDRAMEILHEAWPVTGPDGLIFPSEPGGGVASDMTYNMMMRRLEIPAVPHGFRSSFRNWVEECTATPWAVAEAALAHNVGNATEAAYMRSDLFDQRRQLMQRWAEYVGDAG